MDTKYYRQGDIWLANLNPTKQSEPGRIRPVLIIQNQSLLDAFHSTIIVIPLTTNLIDDVEPLRIRINSQNKLEKNSDLLIDQIRAIDNNRIIGELLLNIGKSSLIKVLDAVNQVISI